MLTISKPLSANQARSYHAQEFTAEGQNYWTQKGEIEGEWHGKLAAEYGLRGGVFEDAFAAMADGKHPKTGEQLVQHRPSTGPDGPVEHRAGWDATFSAPKSVSLTALVGGDTRIVEAHRAAVDAALNELERYTQARIGGNNEAVTTGKFAVAKFEHDTARPVDGYAAPQLHTHCVIFNVTERENGKTNALQPQALFDSQSFTNAVYHSELMHRLRGLGYEIDPGRIQSGRGGAPEIKGYSQEYLEASSPRSKQIRDYLEKAGHDSPAAAQIAAHNTREKKEPKTLSEVMTAHRRIATEFGNQAEKVVTAARERSRDLVIDAPRNRAQEAVTYARDRNFEREAVNDKRAIYRDALRRGMGDVVFEEVRGNFEKRVGTGEFVQVSSRRHQSGQQFTTKETILAEKELLQAMRMGQRSSEPIASPELVRSQLEPTAGTMNGRQRLVIEEILTSPGRIQALQGSAGSGKTSVLGQIRETAEKQGYAVEGFAPTSRAARQLRDSSIPASTLQRFLQGAQKERTADDPTRKHLYMVDESSLTSTNQVRAFLGMLGPQDRVLLVGDRQQHQAIEAGKPFEQLQDAGLSTAALNQIIRQKDPVLLHAVEHLSHGRTVPAMKALQEHGHVSEIPDRAERIKAIAREFVAWPEKTIIVSPDNASRRDINQEVRAQLQEAGIVSRDNKSIPVLVARNEMSGAERAWAGRYEIGDMVQYHRRSKDFAAGSYARVTEADHRENRLTVQKPDGESVTYDPLRLRGITAYREIEKKFSIGDRIQFKAPDRTLKVSNGDLATITRIEDSRITVQTEDHKPRTLTFDAARMPHFDHGYAVTSHSAQGITSERALIHMDSLAHPELMNTRFAYVSISRASHDVHIYVDDFLAINQRICRDVGKTSAVEIERRPHHAHESQYAGIVM